MSLRNTTSKSEVELEKSRAADTPAGARREFFAVGDVGGSSGRSGRQQLGRGIAILLGAPIAISSLCRVDLCEGFAIAFLFLRSLAAWSFSEARSQWLAATRQPLASGTTDGSQVVAHFQRPPHGETTFSGARVLPQQLCSALRKPFTVTGLGPSRPLGPPLAHELVADRGSGEGGTRVPGITHQRFRGKCAVIGREFGFQASDVSEDALATHPLFVGGHCLGNSKSGSQIISCMSTPPHLLPVLSPLLSGGYCLNEALEIVWRRSGGDSRSLLVGPVVPSTGLR